MELTRSNIRGTPSRCCSTRMSTPSALGDVPRHGIYGNVKTTMDRIGAGKAPQVNARRKASAETNKRERTKQ